MLAIYIPFDFHNIFTYSNIILKKNTHIIKTYSKDYQSGFLSRLSHMNIEGTPKSSILDGDLPIIHQLLGDRHDFGNPIEIKESRFQNIMKPPFSPLKPSFSHNISEKKHLRSYLEKPSAAA